MSPESAGRSVAVMVEVIVLTERPDGIGYRMRRGPLHADDHPDTDARELAGFTGQESVALLHSSSWRFEDGRLVLTYVALPDPVASVPHRRVPCVDMTVSADPVEPCPPEVALDTVAAHACRHLAFLARTDPVVATALADLPGMRQRLAHFQPDVAGGLDAPLVQGNGRVTTPA